MTLDAEDIERIAVRVVELQSIRLGQAMPLDPVYTREQAREYVGGLSESAFDRWVARRGVSRCGPGKYRKSALDRALDVSATVLSARRGKRRPRPAGAQPIVLQPPEPFPRR